MYLVNISTSHYGGAVVHNHQLGVDVDHEPAGGWWKECKAWRIMGAAHTCVTLWAPRPGSLARWGPWREGAPPPPPGPRGSGSPGGPGGRWRRKKWRTWARFIESFTWGCVSPPTSCMASPTLRYIMLMVRLWRITIMTKVDFTNKRKKKIKMWTYSKGKSNHTKKASKWGSLTQGF